MRGIWGLSVALGLLVALEGAAWATLGMPAIELEQRYAWEAGPEGTRIYRLGEAYFSPFLLEGRMVGAIAELPEGSGKPAIAALLLELTEGLRHQPAHERGTLEANSWELSTPDYQAMAMRREGKVFVLLQQSAAAESAVEDPVYRAENELEILRMALESYRALHFFRYPEVRSMTELVRALKRAEVLPGNFQLTAPIREFGVWKTGYRITVEAGDQALTILSPERYDPFWVYWQIRPFP